MTSFAATLDISILAIFWPGHELYPYPHCIYQLGCQPQPGSGPLTGMNSDPTQPNPPATTGRGRNGRIRPPDLGRVVHHPHADGQNGLDITILIWSSKQKTEETTRTAQKHDARPPNVKPALMSSIHPTTASNGMLFTTIITMPHACAVTPRGPWALTKQT